MKNVVITKEKKGAGSVLKLPKSEDAVDIKIAYIGGGSRGWAHALMQDLVQCPQLAGEVILYDIDYPAAAFNAQYGNWLQTHLRAVSCWKYRAERSLAKALSGADFVFISIQPGSIEYMGCDLNIPERYGLYHSVGDTVGAAGHIRALRSSQIYRVLTEAIAEHAPKAWILNFTNPMTVCTRTIHHTFAAAKAYGCCHEVFGTQSFLAGLVEKYYKVKKPGREEIDVNVVGINHFTWITRATWKGADILPLVDRRIQEPGAVRPYSKKEILAENNFFGSKHQVTLELYRRFGVLPAAGDRHLAEFVPWFLTDKDSCFRWGFMLTPYSYRINRFRNAPKQFKKRFRRGEFPELYGSGEEYINQMLALVGKTPFKTNINIPNKGQTGNLPFSAIVETNAIFAHNSVEPVMSGNIPSSIYPLIMAHVCNQEDIVKAVAERDKDRAFTAFLREPLMSLSIDKAWKLYNEMLAATKFRF